MNLWFVSVIMLFVSVIWCEVLLIESELKCNILLLFFCGNVDIVCFNNVLICVNSMCGFMGFIM